MGLADEKRKTQQVAGFAANLVLHAGLQAGG
jgi:hypothetical protein